MSQMDGIYRMFDRWERGRTSIMDGNESEKEVEEVIQEVKKIVPIRPARIDVAPRVDVAKGEIFVLGNPSALNAKSYIYANIGGEALCIGETDSYLYDNGKQTGNFLGKKGTTFEGIKEKFEARNVDELANNFREWILKQLSIKYPNDYVTSTPESERYKSETKSGIPFTYVRDFGMDKSICSFCVEGQNFRVLPSIVKKGKHNIASIDARSKGGIPGNQFGKLVIGKDKEVLIALGKMIDEFIKIIKGNHSGIRKTWDTEEFQAIARSFIIPES